MPWGPSSASSSSKYIASLVFPLARIPAMTCRLWPASSEMNSSVIVSHLSGSGFRAPSRIILPAISDASLSICMARSCWTASRRRSRVVSSFLIIDPCGTNGFGSAVAEASGPKGPPEDSGPSGGFSPIPKDRRFNSPIGPFGPSPFGSLLRYRIRIPSCCA